MRSMKKLSVFVSISFLSSSFLVACSQSTSSSGGGAGGSGQSSNSPVTINFVAAEYSNNTEPYWKDLISRFEKENPNIKVNLQVVGWDVLDQKVNTMVSTHQPPDLLDYNQYAQFAADSLLTPMDKMVPKSLMDNMYPSMLQSGQMNGTQYAVPIAGSVRALYYNKDLFAKAGISQPPTNWQELRDDAIKITEKTGVPGFGIPMTNLEGQAYLSYFFWGNGGGWKNGDKWDLNNPKNVEALQFMHDLTFKDHATNPEPTAINRDDMQKVFEQGKIGMMNTANFFATLIKQQAPTLNFGIAPIPVNAGVQPATLGVADYFLSFTKQPEAVGKFLQFFYNDQNYEPWMKKEGFLPATQSVGKNMAKDDPQVGKFIDMLLTAKFYPNSDPNVSKAIVALRSAGEAALSNQKTPKEALDKAQEEMNNNSN